MQPTVVVGVEQAGQVALALVVGADALQQLDRAGGAGDRAGVAGLAVAVEQVGDRAAVDLVARLGEHGQHAGRPEQLADRVVGRMVHHLLERAAERVVAPERRQVGVEVGLGDERVELGSGRLPDLAQPVLELAEASAQVALEQAPQERVGVEGVARRGGAPAVEVVARRDGRVAVGIAHESLR